MRKVRINFGLRPNFIAQIKLRSQSLVSAKDNPKSEVTQCVEFFRESLCLSLLRYILLSNIGCFIVHCEQILMLITLSAYTFGVLM